MPSHPQLNWPRSDGDRSHWPAAGDPGGGVTYYEPSAAEDSRIRAYKDGVGSHLAKYLGLPPPYDRYSADLPPGYRLFTHFQPRDDGQVRTDRYLYGSSKVNKFRSVPEFLEHAVWLFDQSRPLDDHSQCNCKYGGSKSVAKSTPSGSSKRPAASGSGSRKKRAESESSDDSVDGAPTAIVPERLDDFQGERIFRKGEMVFFKIDPILPPAGKAGVPITHWIGLVASSIRRKGVPPDASPAEKWEYNIRALGLFAADEPIIRSAKDVLPFAIGDELFQGGSGWNMFGEEGTNVMRRGVEQEAAEEVKHGYAGGKLTNIEERWKRKWGLRVKFSELGKNWDVWVLRLAIAVKIAFAIQNCWTQTDRLYVIPDDKLSEEDKKDIQEQRKTLWQGVWWGGERLWQGDLVRMRRARMDLPPALGTPGKGAAERAVFFRINTISIEVSPENADPANITQWRCLLYGDVFELVDEEVVPPDQRPGQTLTVPLEDAAAVAGDGKKGAGTNGGSQGMMVPVEKKYRAPNGMAYRQLNPREAEVTADVMDIAGRAYPHLLEFDSQNWYADPSRSAEENKERAVPGDYAKALTGLLSGVKAFTQSEIWKEDLYGMVAQANHLIEKEMREYYGKLLQEQLKASVPRKPRASTEGSGAGGAGGAAAVGQEQGKSVVVGA